MEIKISAFIVEHNISFNTADLVDLLKTLRSNEKQILRSISCNRTKCTAIVTNVIGKSSQEKWIERLKMQKFALLVDKSTDTHSCIKSLAIVTRTVNEKLDIRDEFYDLIPIESATASNIYNVIVENFTKNGISCKENSIAYAADGANSMMGDHNSLKTLLTTDIPDIYTFKCLCHSLALCTSYACAKLPHEVEEFVRNIYIYFQYSFKRQSEFKSFQEFVEVKPHKLLKLLQTRWLSILSVVKRVLEQYNALQLYFQPEFLNLGNVSCENIYAKFSDPTNKFYLEFLEYILPSLVNLNLEFQAEDPKINLIYSKMSSAYKTILECYLRED